MALILLAPACTSAKKKESTISISGAFALYPLVIQWSEVYAEEHPGVRFNISAGGAGKGMADALSGAVDLGMFSREVSPEEMERGAWWMGLAMDAVVPTISENNPDLKALKIHGLSQTQFRQVFLEKTFQTGTTSPVSGKPIRWW
ncbi:MAG: substrate-binding domain-containing protein [Bacteroidales bacterium]